jgi:hypothetical protein|nr:MAG: hypothetical protein [Microviridae sp.]
MKFYTQHDRPISTPEINSGVRTVETAGYIPAKIQIENLLNAGIRLNDYRKEQFDYDTNDNVDHSDDPIPDFTRQPNFDMADATQILFEIEKRKIAAESEKAATAVNAASNPDSILTEKKE